MPAGYPLANTSPCWTRWWVGTKCDESRFFSMWLPYLFQNVKKRTRTDDDSDSDTDNELFLTKDNWPKFIVVKSASEERPFSKLSPFEVHMYIHTNTCIYIQTPRNTHTHIHTFPGALFPCGNNSCWMHLVFHECH